MIVDYWILNDIHFPYEDRVRYPLALEIMYKTSKNKKRMPTHIYLNGDIGEFAPFSQWPKHPGETFTGAQEIDYINKKFDELQALFPGVPVTLIEGNHCYRFFRFIRDTAPSLWGLVHLPNLLKFPERGNWKFVPYGPDQLVRCGDANLYLRHEPLGRGVSHAKGTAENSAVDLAYGHTHTWQSASHKKFGPKPYIVKAYSLGWLGDKAKSVFDYRGPRDSWSEGCTRIECDTVSGQYNLDFIDLQNFPILYRGELFNAKR